jgi:hypothetical protein
VGSCETDPPSSGSGVLTTRTDELDPSDIGEGARSPGIPGASPFAVRCVLDSPSLSDSCRSLSGSAGIGGALSARLRGRCGELPAWAGFFPGELGSILLNV